MEWLANALARDKLNVGPPWTGNHHAVLPALFENILVRRRAWWYNKIPLSFLLLLVLVDGKPFDWRLLAALCGLVVTVAAAANYGYALNELFDRDEDRRAGRSNAVESLGVRRMWAITVLSALVALASALLAGGGAALGLTIAELCLPLGYSAPPVRTKERGWWGVCSDALAAHVYPVLLALIIAGNQGLRTPDALLVATAGVWALAVGLRGILSHQLKTAGSDQKAGLVTVVQRYGHQPLLRVVLWGILPMEVLCLIALLVLIGLTPFVWSIAGLFVIYELVKTIGNTVPATAFSVTEGHYIPFVDEGYYKVWGPLSLLIGLSVSHFMYVIVVIFYCYAFYPRIRGEILQVEMTYRKIVQKIRTVRSGT